MRSSTSPASPVNCSWPFQPHREPKGVTFLKKAEGFPRFFLGFLKESEGFPRFFLGFLKESEGFLRFFLGFLKESEGILRFFLGFLKESEGILRFFLGIVIYRGPKIIAGCWGWVFWDGSFG